ncbi:MAG: sigma-70 family RNA polymerase sigma factor, partial [Planctomycetaceae bacterium]|nr:sigma-70 family RNA polymerase sigma factor [Planctomycetaceae bacterium]
QSIKRALVNSAKTIRIPAYMVELLSKWRRASAKLSEELNRTPTAEDIAREMGIPRKKLRIVKKAIALYNASPQAEQDDSGLSLGDIVPDERTRGPEDELINSDNLIHVFRLLEEMEPREATILKMRFGLDDSEPRTLKEIGESLGLTRERVRQIESEALRKLYRSLSGEA